LQVTSDIPFGGPVFDQISNDLSVSFWPKAAAGLLDCREAAIDPKRPKTELVNFQFDPKISMSNLAGKNIKDVLEIVGVFAVLVGLVFVGFELQQNTASVQAATSQGLLEQSNHSNFLLATDSDFADLVSRGDAGLNDLNEAERLRYRSYIHGEFNIWEQAFYGHNDGTLNDRLWLGYDTGYRSFFCPPSPTIVWRQIEHFFGVEFRTYLNDGALRECVEAGK
jgi:hypothetical protein